MGLRDMLVPNDDRFFDLFERQAVVLKKASAHLLNTFESFEDVKNKCHKMKNYEHQGDEITHDIYQLLNKSFVTPIEPEDISRLAKVLDDILDHIDDTSSKMYFYGITEADHYMVDLAKLIDSQANEIEDVIKEMRNFKNIEMIEEKCIEINRLENLADEILGNALRELFLSDDAKKIIKNKDIYETLEIATDKCEEVANVLFDLAIKHS
ncbi:DUF47 domain-containing protein [Methanolacinia petrolearia]|nr:DUF47 family protein [Methanolacinia petrolearia]